MQIWIHDNKMKKIVALNNDIPDMLSYTNSTWHSYLDQATSTFDFTIPKFSNGELHEDLKLINDECFVSFYVNGSYQVFYIATLQEDDFNIQLTCNNTNLEYALEYANPFNSSSAQSIQWYLEHMDLLSFAAVEIGNNEIPDRKRTLTFDSQETKMNRLQSLMSKFEAEFEFKVELNRDGTYKRIVINIYQENHIGTDRKDVVLYYSNGLKGVQVTSDKTQMFNAGVFDGKDGVNLANVEFSEKNADGVEEFYSRKGDIFVYAPLSMQRYPATMRPDGQDNWIRKDFQTEYENVNDLKAYALRTLKKYAYPLVTYTASVQSGFVSHYTDLKLGDTIRIIDKNFVGGLALEARVSEMIISFDNPANNSFVFTNYRKLDNKPSSALQTRIEQAVESKLPYRIELATTGGVTFKNNEGETTVKPSLYKGNLPWTKDVTWHWTLNGVVTDGMQYRIQARDITDTAVLTVDAFVGGKKVATTEITLTNVNDGPQGPQGDEGPQGPQGDTGNGIANTVVTYGLSVSDTTEPATWSSSVPTLVKGMYLWTRTVIIYTNGESTTSYQISYIAKDADATAAIDKTKQELTEKLETVRNDSLAAVEEAKQELTTVADDLSQAKTDLQNAVSAVDTKATNLKNDLTQAKQDLTSHAQQLQTQANAQSELTKRVSSVEKTANGTKTTVSELSKTVAQNGKDITSVTNRTKTVEDDLAGTKTTLSQVQTTADSTSQKTATLETGLNGLSAKFDSLKIGGTNLLLYSSDPWQAPSGYYAFYNAAKTSETYNGAVVYKTGTAWSRLGINLNKHLVERGLLKVGDVLTYSVLAKTDQKTPIQSHLFVRYDNQSFTENINGKNEIINLTNEWQKVSVTFTVTEKMLSEEHRVNDLGWEQTTDSESGKFVYYTCNKIERGNIATDYSPNDADIEQKVAEYKQTADQNYASLQTTVQNLDGTVQHNKTVADQTAQGFTTRIESLETYKDGESIRANQYFESAKTETAKQLTAERTAIAKDYVAKSTYTSDVTGIRNDLTATTTTANTIKTNLANYQASNDRAVANLQSNMQTANGNISSLKTKVEAVPGQITSAVSAVEGKIPTSIGGRNLYALSKNSPIWDNEISDLVQNVATGEISFKVTGRDPFFGNQANKDDVFGYRGVKIPVKTGQDIAVQLTNELFTKNFVSYFGDDDRAVKNYKSRLANKFVIPASELEGVSYVSFRFGIKEDTQEVGSVHSTKVKVEYGNVYTDWTPAPEDTAEQISNLSSELKQTADGITLLATKTELNTAKNDLQSGINTATNKANAAQNTANSAQNKANSNAQTISTHTNQISALNTGLNAKVSQTEFNTLSGRVTTAENNITAKANELSSKITSVEGKIPTEIGSSNLLRKTAVNTENLKLFGKSNSTISVVTKDGHQAYKIVVSANGSGVYFDGNSQYYNLIKDRSYTFSFWVLTNKDKSYNFNSLGHIQAVNQNGDIVGSDRVHQHTAPVYSTNTIKANTWTKVWCTFKATSNSYFTPYFWYLTAGDEIYIYDMMLNEGKVPLSYTPAPEDTISQISSLSSEFKQTTDSIKASVSSLDKSTVKSSSLTINSDGIVMKAGKTTTDVANAIGSYFAVNQNAINLFSDKINVKGSMIVDGAITGDKIQANSVDVSKISGLDANFIKSKVEYAMIDWLKGKTIVADNGATKIDLLSGYINFDSDTPAIRRVTPGIPTQFVKFLKSDNNSVTTIGSNRDGSESSTNDSFAGIRITSGNSLEQTEIISDQIYFLTGVSSGNRRGWQMSTISGEDDRQITLFPSGNPTKSNIYASDYFIKGSDRWVNLLDFIDYFNTCLKHLQNYTGRYDIWNPFKI